MRKIVKGFACGRGGATTLLSRDDVIPTALLEWWSLLLTFSRPVRVALNNQVESRHGEES
jgi:hypothetical protein